MSNLTLQQRLRIYKAALEYVANRNSTESAYTINTLSDGQIQVGGICPMLEYLTERVAPNVYKIYEDMAENSKISADYDLEWCDDIRPEFLSTEFPEFDDLLNTGTKLWGQLWFTHEQRIEILLECILNVEAQLKSSI